MQFDKDILNILKEIGELKTLKEMDVKKMANEEGYADKLALRLRGRMKTTQLRRFFGAIKDIEKDLNDKKRWEDIEVNFYLLKPKLAYAKGRKLIPEEFHEVVKLSMNKIDIGETNEKIENYKRFVQFLESIVAYHKFHGGE
jgi:CRISPR-associated protein Csm2